MIRFIYIFFILIKYISYKLIIIAHREITFIEVFFQCTKPKAHNSWKMEINELMPGIKGGWGVTMNFKK